MAVSSEMNTSNTSRARTSRRGMAFFIEALVVLFFLMLSLAVFVRLFSGAQIEGMQANKLSEAVLVATNRAEEFSANPTAVKDLAYEGDLMVSCDVEETKMASGILYEATITVSDESGELYVLETARYVHGENGGVQ